MSTEQTHSHASAATPQREKPCDECGTPFTFVRRWQRFCGDACRNEFHRKKAIGPEGRLADLERQVAGLKAALADLERRVAALDDPLRRAA